VLWEWCAHDHGHTQAQLGGPVDTPTTIGDYRPYTCVSGHHAVHPNCATYHYTSPCEKDEVGSECDSVLATLFHTGEVVRIDRKTGEMSTVLRDLKHPHSVRPMPDNRGYSVCNTEKGVITFLHPHSFEVTRSLSLFLSLLYILANRLYRDRASMVDGCSGRGEQRRGWREESQGLCELQYEYKGEQGRGQQLYHGVRFRNQTTCQTSSSWKKQSSLSNRPLDTKTS